MSTQSDFMGSSASSDVGATGQNWQTAEFWVSHVQWCPDWIAALPREYWERMVPSLATNYFRWPNFIDWAVTGGGGGKMADQLITRMAQAAHLFVPWLGQALPLEGAQVLEIGAGSGSSTAALARAGAKVTGVDLSPDFIEVNKIRLQALQLEADVHAVDPDWLAQDVFGAPFDKDFDAIVCYALLEHLYPLERLNLLRACKRLMERTGAALVLFETPNRFAPYDWHSTKLPFADMLPDELMFEYSKLSPRPDIPAKRLSNNYEEATAQSWRLGRGASWHEFHLVFGLDNLEVILDGYDPMSGRHNAYQADPDYEAALAKLFATLTPPVPKGFCRPSLDLAMKLKKVA